MPTARNCEHFKWQKNTNLLFSLFSINESYHWFGLLCCFILEMDTHTMRWSIRKYLLKPYYVLGREIISAYLIYMQFSEQKCFGLTSFLLLSTAMKICCSLRKIPVRSASATDVLLELSTSGGASMTAYPAWPRHLLKCGNTSISAITSHEAEPQP